MARTEAGQAGQARPGRPDTTETTRAIEAIELLRAVGDELDATCGVSRGPLRALAALPEAIVAIVGALSPSDPNAMILCDADALARLATVGRAARGAVATRRTTLDISPAGYADLLRAIGLFAEENGWRDLRLLPFARGLVLYHDGEQEVVLGERRLREVINGAFRRRADVEPALEDLTLTRRAALRPLRPRQFEPRPYSYAGALAALGYRLGQGRGQYPLIADVEGGLALVSNAPNGRPRVEMVAAEALNEDAGRRRGIRRPPSTALREELRAVGAYLDRAHAREVLVQRRPATVATPTGSFALAFTALSGSSGGVGSFGRCLVPTYVPGTPDYEVEELWGQ